MAITKVTSGMVTPDPTNASNLSSGDVPLAQLGNVPASDTSSIESDIALLGFKVASNGSLSKYNLVDQTEDAFADQTGVDASTSTNEVYNTAGFYTGTVAEPTGGTETTYTDSGTDYVVRSFLSGTTNLVFNKAGTVDYLLVAGGGAGGYSAIPGGGGAGGLLTATGLSVAIGTYPIVVGAGGVGDNSGGVANSGDNTTAFSLTAIGGGKGAVGPGTVAAASGGSGGGQDGYGSGGGATGTAGQGNSGGNGAGGGGSYGAGGGGGAGAVGANGVSPSGGAGGVGLSNSLRTGSGVFYAGGGGGQKWTGSVGAGGNGGGGAGGVGGTANTGGGAGGGGGSGGSGIAVVRWVADSFGPDYNNMTLVSNATTAESTPTKGDIVMTYTNGVGTATLNTDLTAEFSADNGATWTSTTLVAQGNTGSASPHFIVAAHNVSLTSTSGTTMRYRIKTLNQSVSKETRIQAVSLGWS